MKTMIFLIAVFALSACQNNRSYRLDYAEFVQQQGLVKQNRVQQFRFQGWVPLNDRYLILRSNQRKSYLVKLMSPCNELQYAQSIQVNQESTRTLVAKFDSIVVPGQLRQECTIDDIYKMDKLQKQAVLDFSNQTDEIRGN